MQLSPKGEVNSGGYIKRDPKRLYIYIYIYIVLFTVPDGDSCFSIYQRNQLNKNKKSNFCKLKTSLSRNFVYNFIQTFQEFCQVHFYNFVA